MNTHDHLHLAALLHDIGKFRQRGTQENKPHQEHSYEFITQDFTDFFSECDDTFKNAIRHHHQDTSQLTHLIEKQVVLADRLSATEADDEGSETEGSDESVLVSPLSTLKGANQIYAYSPTELNLENKDTVIPSESPVVHQDAYTSLWEIFKKDFRTATEGRHYKPSDYQTIVALLHKYTSRIPTAQRQETTEQDISLYDHLRTTAAIAACIDRELSEEEVDAQLCTEKAPDKVICTLIKGDISGIQNFLYHILSDGASNQLRGRSFYLQLLTETIAQWVLRQLNLPVTNLLLASGGHFYILAPYTATSEKLDVVRQTISQNLLALHNGDLFCTLASVPVKSEDFEEDNFSDKWREVSEQVQKLKQQKWSELEAKQMFDNFFEPHEQKDTDLGFVDLGMKLRHAKYLVTFDVQEAAIPQTPTCYDAVKAFGIDFHISENVNDDIPIKPEHTNKAVIYRLADTDFLTEDILNNFQWEGCAVSNDFRASSQVIPLRNDRYDQEVIADYNYLAEASQGVHWFGALRMDVDDLGTVFTEKLQKATISRLATLSEALRTFFEGYVPQLCRNYNAAHDKEILELIYAGGDDLFLVGGWSALPDIAEQIRSQFRHFVTGDHITLSGGIAIEHKKFPLYQFAARSGEAEDAAKDMDGKNAITFLHKPMTWEDFDVVRDWHQKFKEALESDKRLPRDILTRLSQIYSAEELKGYRWAWRSIYYFHRLLERNRSQEQFVRKLQGELNLNDTYDLKQFIHVITRWTALRIR